MSALRALREERKLTQAELARLAGVSPRTISYHENTAMRPYTNVRRALASTLGVPAESIWPPRPES